MNNSRRGQRSNGMLLLIIAASLLAVLVILFFTFRIRKVTVTGEYQRYSPQEIQGDMVTGNLEKNSLYFVWKYRNKKEYSEVPYLESAQAKLISPGQVKIIVQEKKLVGGLTYDSQYYYYDKTGTVVAQSGTPLDGIPIVSGITMDKPEIYQKIPVSNTALRSTMLSISSLMLEYGLDPDSISFDENNNISVTIGTVLVELGQDEYLEEKVANLQNIYKSVASQTGTLKMSAFTGKNENITFEATIPETPAEAETETNPKSILTSSTTFQAFDSNGVIHNNCHVVNGVVVDEYGTEMSGCYIDDDGNVIDAYMNNVAPGLFTAEMEQVRQMESEAAAAAEAAEAAAAEAAAAEAAAAEAAAAQQAAADAAAQAGITAVTPETTVAETDANTAGSETSADVTGTQAETQADTQAETQAETKAEETEAITGGATFQAFDSNGLLHNDAQVVNGQVVDSYGNPIAGCYVNSDGYAVDAYMNRHDAKTGEYIAG